MKDKSDSLRVWQPVHGGDVKQSIYKFRQADPSLFIPGSGRVISLNHNFRSRGEVIDLTNAVFERIMDKEVGEVEYDETHRLVQGNYLDAPPLPTGTSSS